MAKALMGHLATDPRLASEVVSLRAKVRALKSEVEELRTALALQSAQDVDLSSAAASSDLDSELAELHRATPALA